MSADGLGHSDLEDESKAALQGFGPLIPPLSESMRPLRQQVFDRVRATGLVARVQVAKDLGVSPATVTTITSELIEAGLTTNTSMILIPGETDKRSRSIIKIMGPSVRATAALNVLYDKYDCQLALDFSE